MTEAHLSVCILAGRDGTFLPDCLASVKCAADEIVVADLGSGGRVRELAEQAGAVVYRPEWEDDFSKIRNFCMERCTGEWVLFLQADERIDPEQHQELKLLLQNPCAEAYLLKSGSGEDSFCPSQLLRLLRNRKNYRFRYRSFAYIPDEELYSVQTCAIRVMRPEGKGTNWQLKERLRLLSADRKEHPADGYVRYLEGVSFLRRGKYEKSAAFLEQARGEFSGGRLYVPHLYRCLGACLLELKRDREAEEVLTEGFRLFPLYTDLLVLRAKLYRRLGDDEKAVDDLRTGALLQGHPGAFVPEPEIGLPAIKAMLEKILADHGGGEK